MKTIPKTLLVAVAVAFAAPAAAQDDAPADTTAPAAEASAEATAETAAPAAEAEAPARPAQPSHDWEFALSPTDKAPGARGTVKVTDGDASNAFVLETSGLPVVDSLDTEGRDVNAYTVWVVPSKDRVTESTFAGVLEMDAETGGASFEGSSDLDSFGIIVTATEDGAPARIGGVPVLTGIPVRSQAETPADTAAPAADAPAAEPGDAPAPVEEPEAPAPEPESTPEPEPESTTP